MEPPVERVEGIPLPEMAKGIKGINYAHSAWEADEEYSPAVKGKGNDGMFAGRYILGGMYFDGTMEQTMLKPLHRRVYIVPCLEKSRGTLMEQWNIDGTKVAFVHSGVALASRDLQKHVPPCILYISSPFLHSSHFLCWNAEQ